MKEQSIEELKRPQLVHWTAVFWAALIAGAVFFLTICFLVPLSTGGNAWVMIRLLASIVLGPRILAPPATFDFSALVVGIAVHFVLSCFFTALLAWVTHRWGLITGIFLGGLFGWSLYLINIYTLTLFFPWFMVMKHWAFLAAHVVFGMTAGGLYELLENDPYDEEMIHTRRRKS